MELSNNLGSSDDCFTLREIRNGRNNLVRSIEGRAQWIESGDVCLCQRATGHWRKTGNDGIKECGFWPFRKKPAHFDHRHRSFRLKRLMRRALIQSDRLAIDVPLAETSALLNCYLRSKWLGCLTWRAGCPDNPLPCTQLSGWSNFKIGLIGNLRCTFSKINSNGVCRAINVIGSEMIEEWWKGSSRLLHRSGWEPKSLGGWDPAISLLAEWLLIIRMRPGPPCRTNESRLAGLSRDLPIQRRRLNVCNSFLVTVSDEKEPADTWLKAVTWRSH